MHINAKILPFFYAKKLRVFKIKKKVFGVYLIFSTKIYAYASSRIRNVYKYSFDM